MTEPGRILHVITRLILGGAQQNTVMSCAAQVKAGHRVWLAYGPVYGPEGSLEDEAHASGAECVVLRSMRRAVLPGHDVLVYRELRKLIARIRPDVVHTHSSKAGIVGRAAAWAERVPAVIHTVHGLPFHDRQNVLVHRLYVALERWAARRCHHLIAITPAMVEAFVTRDIAPREKFTVVPSGVDLSKFEANPNLRSHVRREWRIPADAPVLGIVARLDPLKGHDDLLDIMPALLERLPELRLVCIGDGWNRCHLEQRVRREALSERVLFTNLVPHDEIARLLTAVDVKVLPSYQEGQSRTLIEALLCGCGIVAYNVGGMPSICIDEPGRQTGRLVPPGDLDALGDAIVWMFEHPDERREMVERGQRHVRKLFDADLMNELIQAVYDRTLNNRK
jgi:glycosyltransferase involved in cell wall biosynthesis